MSTRAAQEHRSKPRLCGAAKIPWIVHDLVIARHLQRIRPADIIGSGTSQALPAPDIPAAISRAVATLFQELREEVFSSAARAFVRPHGHDGIAGGRIDGRADAQQASPLSALGEKIEAALRPQLEAALRKCSATWRTSVISAIVVRAPRRLPRDIRDVLEGFASRASVEEDVRTILTPSCAAALSVGSRHELWRPVALPEWIAPWLRLGLGGILQRLEHARFNAYWAKLQSTYTSAILQAVNFIAEDAYWSRQSQALIDRIHERAAAIVKQKSAELVKARAFQRAGARRAGW